MAEGPGRRRFAFLQSTSPALLRSASVWKVSVSYAPRHRLTNVPYCGEVQRLHELVRESKPAAFINRQAHLTFCLAFHGLDGRYGEEFPERKSASLLLKSRASNSSNSYCTSRPRAAGSLEVPEQTKEGPPECSRLSRQRRTWGLLVLAGPRPSPSQELRVELLPFAGSRSRQTEGRRQDKTPAC